MDKDAFISKCMLKDESKLEFDCNPKSISQLETLPFETESLLKNDSNDDKVSFSYDDSAKAQLTTEAALPSDNGSNKKSHSSAQKQVKKCSRKRKRKRKRAPTVQKGEHALIGGFAADEIDEDASILKWMVEDKLKLEYNCNHISIRQFEKCPSETESLFKDDSNNDWWARIPTLDVPLLLDM
ncbi:hypothetical protein B7P43_G17511 [Cryptotermes secundus]|uniref:Uncharacterized protein n=2 Tax=Cryptotermes secundus TaxID=105785 RepID=A0A2J7NKB1_9NEOP|nr:hypothetical protein B7P43_G17511 [Cryptotermes secundus]